MGEKTGLWPGNAFWRRATSPIRGIAASGREGGGRFRAYRRAREQRCAPDDVQLTGRDFRRGMGPDLGGQYFCDALPDQGSAPAHAAGSAIINTASINADAPNPHLLAYATSHWEKSLTMPRQFRFAWLSQASWKPAAEARMRAIRAPRRRRLPINDRSAATNQIISAGYQAPF